MKVGELIKKLKQTGMDNEVVIPSVKGVYTPDIGVGIDNNGDVEIYELAGSRGY